MGAKVGNWYFFEKNKPAPSALGENTQRGGKKAKVVELPTA